MSATNWVRTRSSSRRLVQALLLSSALAGVGGARAAYAQAAPAAPAAAAPASTGLSEVVVTARRREENLQTTPVAVTAMSNDTIQQLNARNFQDLRGTIPNLEVQPLATGGANLTIRGIGQGSSQVNTDAKTGFYVDEMYVARQEGNQLYFYDVDSLQVLKGPQGTLFGKNTTAGAFLLTTARPGPEAGGYVDVRAGNMGRLDTEGAINAPINDKVLTRFSFRTDYEDGYIKHVVDKDKSNNINDKSVRAQIRLLPASGLTVDLLGEYNRQNTNGNASVVIGCRDNASYPRTGYNPTHLNTYCRTYPILDQSNGWVVYGGATLNIPTSANVTDKYRGADTNPGNIPFRASGGHNNPFNDTEVKTVNLRLNYELTPDIALKSITATRRSTSRFYNPTQDAPNDIYAEYDTTATSQFTEEVNLNGKGVDGRLNYVLGAFYYDQKTHFLQDTGPDWIDPTGYTYDANNHFKSYAFYGQASFKILDPLELTVGARYSHDQKSAVSNLNFQTNFSGPLCGATPAAPGVPARTYFENAFALGGQKCNGLLFGQGDQTWHSFDPRVQLSYQFTPDIFVYGSITKGYNAGGFNQQLGANLPGHALISYNPEKLKAYEVGAKTEFWERRGRLNVDYFYQSYTDIQTTILVTYAGVPTRAVQTGATAHEEGIEGEFELRPIPDLTLSANAAWLHQKYDSIAAGITAFTLTSPVNATPKFTYAISGSYDFHLAGGRGLRASLNWRGVSSRPSCSPLQFGIDPISGFSCTIPSYGLLGGRLEFSPTEDSPWSISLWGNNLLDKTYYTGIGLGGGMGVDTVSPGRGREYGIEVRRRL